MSVAVELDSLENAEMIWKNEESKGFRVLARYIYCRWTQRVPQNNSCDSWFGHSDDYYIIHTLPYSYHWIRDCTTTVHSRQ